ncbi:hypothetical protein COLO4_21020 [Corchorus olitorius]|uniref:Neprosin PEP catalytic domain-containing protein n=1 Tax=Corchorus olitorius TaxID=93759 RepID=A0A1R3IVJ6_9ROSI|nr:hypothetical protein COLO4_21020 [Corchorus olitorius]
MAKLISGLFLVLVLSYLSERVDGKPTSSRKTLEDVDRKLKLLNKPAVKSIKSEDGDIIDCVDIHKQPAFDHPALKNHTIQLKPSFDLPQENLTTKNEQVYQIWQRSGSCPEGTVPIRRIRREDLLRAASLDDFGRKPPQIFSASNRTDQKHSRFVYFNNTEHSLGPIENRSAAILVTLGYNYIGAKGDINIWNPSVEKEGEFTTAQIWLKGGPGDDFESMESGWVVNPTLYGDRQTRFFAYWTTDAYKKTGCFDLTCSGFVQTSPKYALGAAFPNISGWFGPQYYLPVGIYMDPQSSNWWLKIGNTNISIGYWPAESLMYYLKHSATLVEWGGQVYSPNVKKTPHTKTAMGSGDFAAGLGGSACFIMNARIIDFSQTMKYPQWVDTWADEVYCYTAYNYVEGYGSFPVFYFGGPGQNPNCP